MATKKTNAVVDEETVPYCDNHPQTVAVVSTTSSGAHSAISLCAACKAAFLR